MFSELAISSGLNFTADADSIKKHIASLQKEGQIKLYQKFELNISKNGRDIAQFRLESRMYTILTISLYRLYSRQDDVITLRNAAVDFTETLRIDLDNSQFVIFRIKGV